jgi:hypothetical protein
MMSTDRTDERNWWEQYELAAPATAEQPQPTSDRAPMEAEPQRVVIEQKRENGGRDVVVLKPAEQPAGNSIARQLGLALRAGVQGVAALPGMVADAATGVVNAGLDAVRGPGNGFRFQRTSEALGNVMDAAGVPQPANATERVVQDVVSAGMGAGATVGAARKVAQVGGEVAQGVGRALAQGPGAQAASSAAGAGAAGAVREDGGSDAAQIGAGLAAGLGTVLAPAAGGAAARGLMRGGEGGRQAAAQRLADFDAAGVQPTLGQVTQNPAIRGAESVLARTPGASGALTEFARRQQDDMGRAVEELASALAPDGAGPVEAGKAITRGLRVFKADQQNVQTALYRQADALIPANTPVTPSATVEALARLNADIPGAESLSRFFRNAKVADVEVAMLDDLTNNGGQALPWEAMRKLRTMVHEEGDRATFTSDVPRSVWRTLGDALTTDLTAAAQAQGPEAVQAWQMANRHTATMMRRLDELRSVVENDTPEAVFRAIQRDGLHGYTTAKRVFDALPESERPTVAAAVLLRMGRATGAEAGAAGDGFSSERFLAAFGQMSPVLRKTLFGPATADDVLEKVEALARVAETRRMSGPAMSGSDFATTQADRVGLIGGAGVSAAAMAGNPSVLAGAAAAAGAANLTAKGLTSRAAVEMAATPTTLMPGTAGAAVQAAGRIDPDAPNTELSPDSWWTDQPVVQAAPTMPTPPPSPLEVAQAEREQARLQAQQGMADIGRAQSVGDAIEAFSRSILPSTEPPKLSPTTAMSKRPALVMGSVFDSEAQAREAAQYAGMGDAEVAADGAGFVVLPRRLAAPGTVLNTTEPVLWTGRRGDGYETPEAAGNALAQRRQARPDLEWTIQRNADNRFILVGRPDPTYPERQRIERIEAERQRLQQMRPAHAM